MPRSRKWLITINNPLDHGFDHARIKAAVLDLPSVVYWCMCDEQGDECETLHTHVYVVTREATSHTQIDARFPSFHRDIARGKSSENRAYVLKDGDEALAKITLSGSDVNWAVSDVELELEGTKSASVEVAVGSKVFCNGIELGSEYAGETQNNFSYEPLKDKLINPVSWTTYKVDGLLIEPELTAEPPAGCSVTKTAEGDFMLCLDGADAEKYTTRAVSFVKAYLTYYMNGYNGTWGNLYAALAYLTPCTQAYTDLQDTYNGVVWNTAYGNIDVSNTTASGVVIWADNCYSVDVTYDANCTHNGQAIDYADATMRIYFLQTDAGFVISNYETL